MLKHFLFAVILGTLILLGYTYYYTGLYRPVSVKFSDQQSYTLIGTEHRGAYHEISKKIMAVEKWVQSQGFDCRESFGLYYDNPDVTETRHLRSFGGCVLPGQVSEEKMNLLLQEKTPYPLETRIFDYPAVLEAYFEGAPSVGPLKVYPVVREFAQKRGLKLSYPVLEKYVARDNQQLVIYYYFPLEFDSK